MAGPAGRSWENPLKPFEKTPTDFTLARTEPAKPLVGKHVPAQKGLRVSVRPGFSDEGIGTISDVHPTGGHCSVRWDHGREDSCVFTGDSGDYYLCYEQGHTAKTPRMMGTHISSAAEGEDTFGPASPSRHHHHQPAQASVPILSVQPPGPQYISGSPSVEGLQGRGAQGREVEELIASLSRSQAAGHPPLIPAQFNAAPHQQFHNTVSPQSPHFGAASTTVPGLQDESGGQYRVLKAAQSLELGEKFSHTTPSRPTPTDEAGSELLHTGSSNSKLAATALHPPSDRSHGRRSSSSQMPMPSELQDMSSGGAMHSPSAPLTYDVTLQRGALQGAAAPGPGEHVGIGINIRGTPEGLFLITAVTPHGPAAALASRIKFHLISAVDAESVVGLSLQDVIKRIKGPPDTRVTLTVSRDPVPSDAPAPQPAPSVAKPPDPPNRNNQLGTDTSVAGNPIGSEAAAPSSGVSAEYRLQPTFAGSQAVAHQAGPGGANGGSTSTAIQSQTQPQTQTNAAPSGVSKVDDRRPKHVLSVVIPQGAQAGQVLMTSRFVIACKEFGSKETGATVGAEEVCVLIKEGDRGWILLQNTKGAHAWYPKSYAIVCQPIPYTVPRNCAPGTRVQLPVPPEVIAQAQPPASKVGGAQSVAASAQAREASQVNSAHAHPPNAHTTAPSQPGAGAESEAISKSGPTPPPSIIHPVAPAGMAEGTPIVSSDAAQQPVVWIFRSSEEPAQPVHVMHLHFPSLHAMGLRSFAPLAEVVKVAGETAAHLRALPGMSPSQLQAWQQFGFTQEHIPPQAATLMIPPGASAGMQMQASPYKTLVSGFPVTYLFRLPPGAQPGTELKLHLPRLVIPHYGPHGLFVQHVHLPQVGMPSIRLPAFTDFDLALLARNLLEAEKKTTSHESELRRAESTGSHASSSSHHRQHQLQPGTLLSPDTLQQSQQHMQQVLKQQQLQQQLLRQQQQALADGFTQDPANQSLVGQSTHALHGSSNPTDGATLQGQGEHGASVPQHDREGITYLGRRGSRASSQIRSSTDSMQRGRMEASSVFAPETEMTREREVQVGCAQTRGRHGVRQAVQQAVQMAVKMCETLPSAACAEPKPLVRVRIALPLHQPEIREVDLDLHIFRQAIQLQLLPHCTLLPIEVADGGTCMRTLAKSQDAAQPTKGLGGLADRGPLIVVVAVVAVGS